MTAPGPFEGLEILRKTPGFAVVVSDMRMPVMDGATFLANVRTMAPESVRVLLTGQSDLEAAALAINEGQIFRFLLKPCPPKTLVAAMHASVAQHRLVTAERVLLEETLHGSVKTLSEILAMAYPAAFGRSARARSRK